MKNSKVFDFSSIRSLQIIGQRRQRHQQKCSISLKFVCCCLLTLIIIGAIAAVATILSLQNSKTSTSSATTTTTTISSTTMTTTTPFCYATSSYSDSCSGNPPLSKYISSTIYVTCRQNAVGALVLGYRFLCGGFAPCSVDSQCGQDGFCDQYCVLNSCSSLTCNQNSGNCAKLATGLNCGAILPD